MNYKYDPSWHPPCTNTRNYVWLFRLSLLPLPSPSSSSFSKFSPFLFFNIPYYVVVERRWLLLSLYNSHFIAYWKVKQKRITCSLQHVTETCTTHTQTLTDTRTAHIKRKTKRQMRIGETKTRRMENGKTIRKKYFAQENVWCVGLCGCFERWRARNITFCWLDNGHPHYLLLWMKRN